MRQSCGHEDHQRVYRAYNLVFEVSQANALMLDVLATTSELLKTPPSDPFLGRAPRLHWIPSGRRSMSQKSLLQDPNHWRERAEVTRTYAESYAYRKSRDRLLEIAEEYERLAERAEQWQSADQRYRPAVRKSVS
jgi:hypothetical protein